MPAKPFSIIKPFYSMALLLASASAALLPQAAHAATTGQPPAAAQSPSAATLSTGQAATLIEDYFNHLNTLAAHFSQHASNEEWTYEGTLYLHRPKQFLWKYETPHKQRVIGTGTAVYYVDDESGQVTQMPTSGGIARLLGSPKVELSKLGLKITTVHQNGQTLDITLAPVKPDTQLRQVTLTFNTANGLQNLALESITATDSLNVITRVDLSDVQRGVALDKKLFAFTPPQYQQN